MHCPADVRRLFLLQSNARVFYHSSIFRRSTSQLCRQEPYQEINRQRLRTVREDFFISVFGHGDEFKSRTPDEKFDGHARAYQLNGVAMIYHSYRSGLEHGIWEDWHLNGMCHERSFHVNNEVHGESCIWHSNGQLHYRWHWHHGKRHGLVESWDDEGHLVLQEEWEYGVRVKGHI